MKSYLGKTCPFCNQETLEIDDIDYNFQGNQDEYLICENCKSHIFVKVRFGKIIKLEKIPIENEQCENS